MEITKSKPVRLRFRFTLDNIYQVHAAIDKNKVTISQSDLNSIHLEEEERCEVVALIRDRITSIYKTIGK